MDVYVGGRGARTARAIAGTGRLLEEVGAPHRAQPLGSSLVAVWRDERSSQVLHHVDERFEVVFDGYLHGHGSPSTQAHLPELARRVADEGRVLDGEESGIFSIVVHDRRDGRLLLGGDPSGLLPLHLALDADGPTFASHHHLLAQAIDAPPDPAGVAWTVLQKWAPGRRTAYRGVERLCAGELVTVHADGRVERAFPEVYFDRLVEPTGDAADEMWEALLRATRPHAQGDGPVGLMLSEGFDSRLVAGALREVDAPTRLYTHGTEGTAGLEITRTLARTLGAPHHVEPLEHGFPWEHQQLRRQLLLADNLSIPYWAANAEAMRADGVRAATTGYALDSTVGAHAFVPPTTSRRRAALDRYRTIAAQRLGRLRDEDLVAMATARLGSLHDLDLPGLERRIRYFLAADVAEVVVSGLGELAADVHAELDRLRSTGDDRDDLVLQRWFLEGRVRRFSFGQELTLRSQVPLIVPSYEPAAMRAIGRVPPRLRYLHDAYLRLLRRHERDLAKVTSGAHGLPATYPRTVLETAHFAAVAREGKLVDRYLADGSIDLGKLRAVLFAEHTARLAPQLPIERLGELDLPSVNLVWSDALAEKIRSRERRVYTASLYLPTELAQVFDRR